MGSPLPDGSFREGTVAVDEEPTVEQLRPLHKCIEKVRFLKNITMFSCNKAF